VPLLLYTLYRVLVFAAAFGLLFWAGANPFLAVALAAVIAFAVSYLFLRGPRDAAASWLAARAERRSRRGERFSREAEADAAFEDAVVDADEGDAQDAEATGEGAPPQGAERREGDAGR
jgi:ABC-type siderophore export system fused ATPase/permease subunit